MATKMAATLSPSGIAVMFYFHVAYQFLFQYMHNKITLLMRACCWLFLGWKR